jgi:tetratricopeptide (TPR) repeat protein
MGDRLRSLWDFDDLDASEERLRAGLDDEASDAGRAEVLTQLARVEGLRGRFEKGEQLIQEAEGLAADSRVADARILLERGRLLNSGGKPEAALPLFERAVDVALEAGEDFIAADAAHMAAIAAPDSPSSVAWTQRGIEIAAASLDAAYWRGLLYNNLGWFRFEAGDHAAALDAFERALEARQLDPDKPYEIAIARYAVAKALRALGRTDEAAVQAEQAVRWSQESQTPDGWFHEELAEDYAALGRDAEAAEQAHLALPLLEEQDPSLADDDDRRARLEDLAGR